MPGVSLDLEEQLVFYGAYHNNKWNQLVHIIFVPMLWWTGVVMIASYFPPLLSVPPGLDRVLLPGLELDLATLLFLVYAGLYVAMEPKVGLTFDAVLYVLFATAKWYAGTGPSAFTVALVLHVASWTAQVAIGHGVFEGRAPALLDSLFQSFLLAPLFVFYEVLFNLGMYRRLRERVQKRINIKIAEFKREQARKKASTGGR